MSKTTFLSRRRFVKTAGVFCATLAGTGALSACASESAVPAAEPESTPEPEPQPETPASDEVAITAEAETPEDDPATDATAQARTGNVLVAYFSYPETTEASDSDNLNTEEENSVVVKDGQIIGNTEYVAGIVARETGADTFRILTTRTYPVDHQALISQAQEEMNANDRPELAEPIPDLSGYDTVFIGHPIWWADLPPVVYSFLEQADLAGKPVYLFNTHGGSGNAGTKETIKGILSESNVSDDNFVVSRDTVDACEPDILTWLRGLGF